MRTELIMAAFRGGCSRLSSVELMFSDITDIALLWLNDISTLVNLGLPYCQRVTDLGIYQIANASWAPQLRNLNVSDCELLSDVSLTHISRTIVKLADNNNNLYLTVHPNIHHIGLTFDIR